MKWVIEYYVSEDDKCPVKDFIDSLSPEAKTKYIFIADLLEQYGIHVREPYIKAIAGRRKLFEIRIKDKSNIHRIIYFVFTGRTLILITRIYQKDAEDAGKRD